MPLKLKDKSALPRDAILYPAEGKCASPEHFFEVDFSDNEALRQRDGETAAHRGRKPPPSANRDQPRPPADKIARVA